MRLMRPRVAKDETEEKDYDCCCDFHNFLHLLPFSNFQFAIVASVAVAFLAEYKALVFIVADLAFMSMLFVQVYLWRYRMWIIETHLPPFSSSVFVKGLSSNRRSLLFTLDQMRTAITMPINHATGIAIQRFILSSLLNLFTNLNYSGIPNSWFLCCLFLALLARTAAVFFGISFSL